MALYNGCFVQVWGFWPSKTGLSTSVRCTNSVKKQATGEYETEFSGFITFAGEANKNIQPYINRVSENRKPIMRLKLDNIAFKRTENPGQEGIPWDQKKYTDTIICYAFSVEEPNGNGQPVAAQNARPKYDPSIPENTIEEELPFN